MSIKNKHLLRHWIVFFLLGGMQFIYSCGGSGSKKTQTGEESTEIDSFAEPEDTLVVKCVSEDSNLVLIVGNLRYTLVRVLGGTFMMGATSEQLDECHADELPAHEVTVDDYYIGQTEVPQDFWEALMGEDFNPSYIKGDKRPVEQIYLFHCRRFLSRLNKLTGREFRLPTEAEWEYAARGGRYSRGYKFAGSNNLDDVAYYNKNSGTTTHPVASKAPNELGLYDMSGNVWEWCHGRYGNYPKDSQGNSQGAENGEQIRVLRGGSWSSYRNACRVSNRSMSDPDVRYDYYRGIRIVLDS